MWADIINGLLEFGGAMLICLSIKQLYYDKCVRGVSPYPVAFFAGWGFWNIYYYPSLNQWFSFAGGLAIVTVNTIWICQMIYYIYLEKNGNSNTVPANN